MNKLKKSKEMKGIPLSLHLLFCLAILIIPLVIMFRNGIGEYNHYIGYLIRTGMLIALFYINYLYLIDQFLFKKKIGVYIALNIALIIGSVFLQNLFFEFLLPPKSIENMENRPRPPHELRILGDYILNILAVGLSLGLKATQRWYSDSINLETAKASQLEADLKNLRSQLNPHFLFNTLNNIYSLIAIDSNKAQESVHRLSNLLRYILYENEQKFVPIDKELEFTRNYIDLMSLRLSPDIRVRVKIDNESGDKPIASLLFMTLIENAFKHGISNGADSFIDIHILADAQGTLCTVENSIGEKENMEAKNPGIGLINLRKRLELLYPNNHELRIEEKEQSFYVYLYTGFNSN